MEQMWLPGPTKSTFCPKVLSLSLPPPSPPSLLLSCSSLAVSVLDWVKMTAVDKTDGVPAELSAGAQTRTVWVGGLPTAAAENDAELKRDLGWFGAVQSISVRVKPGYRKSWALVTLVEPESAQLMLGRESKQFRLKFGHKGYDSLVFLPDKADEQLRAGGKQGALASIVAGQAAKNADTGAVAGWHGNISLASRAPHHPPKPSNRVATREPADYLVRKRSTNSVLHTSAGMTTKSDGDDHARHEMIKGSSGTPRVYRNEFEEKDLVYIPGRGYFVGSSPSMTERDREGQRGTEEEDRKRQADRQSESTEKLEPKRADAEKQWIVGPAAHGTVRTTRSGAQGEQVCSPKLTVAFSQSPYTLISYRVSTSGCSQATATVWFRRCPDHARAPRDCERAAPGYVCQEGSEHMDDGCVGTF